MKKYELSRYPSNFHLRCIPALPNQISLKAHAEIVSSSTDDDTFSSISDEIETSIDIDIWDDGWRTS